MWVRGLQNYNKVALLKQISLSLRARRARQKIKIIFYRLKSVLETQVEYKVDAHDCIHYVKCLGKHFYQKTFFFITFVYFLTDSKVHF